MLAWSGARVRLVRCAASVAKQSEAKIGSPAAPEHLHVLLSVPGWRPERHATRAKALAGRASRTPSVAKAAAVLTRFGEQAQTLHRPGLIRSSGAIGEALADALVGLRVSPAPTFHVEHS
jgi:hypothetical protein